MTADDHTVENIGCHVAMENNRVDCLNSGDNFDNVDNCPEEEYGNEWCQSPAKIIADKLIRDVHVCGNVQQMCDEEKEHGRAEELLDEFQQFLNINVDLCQGFQALDLISAALMITILIKIPHILVDKAQVSFYHFETINKENCADVACATCEIKIYPDLWMPRHNQGNCAPRLKSHIHN
uniref:Uncharacterized protein n=1 Tax=Bracon brevicornis TaxID=1563983 RepID=A0A6V7JBI2_9HYME